VVGAARARAGGSLLIVTENGYGKRTALEEYIRGSGDPQHRGGYGLKGYQVTDKTGPVAGVKVVDEDDDILLISDDGVIIRMAASSVNTYSRTAQGVILMRLPEGVKVISLARTVREEAEEQNDACPCTVPDCDGDEQDEAEEPEEESAGEDKDE
jgi:DNA gyrase subunit A